MYKLIGLDMDGTLLNSQKQISARTQAAIQAAKDKGVQIVLSSGRPIEGLRAYLDLLGLNREHDYVVHYNGSFVENVLTGEIIRQQVVSAADVKTIGRTARALNVNTHAFSQRLGLITPKSTEYTRLEAQINGIEIHEIDFETLDDDHPMIKAMIVDEPEKLAQAYRNLPAAVVEQFTIVQSAPYFLEFLNPQSNKGLGIQAVAERLGIPAELVMCIGDAENDHHMLEYAGLGIAMENAMPQTKAIADYITASNDEDGVARAIEKFVLA
ncbi:sugar-phosphatase [Vibrio sp. MEBiC08052]|uniref:sugar-phosphatase n=1 Tax=Vibrio sp. MEBiC08052 TaxID=1761910 RepID=UPI00074074B5|nr:sugar-phosphatase [Vibrio sp. MEBiC08052]KUI99174.1 hydrolase [Vibrio sp. MEBiC08052]